ncbi:IS66-like element accessory protein TnpA [Agrobacterium tumefaciens]|uniref:IS66-like element accessory protein TnpA n=1 Tax=Agrobacterium tumefaciens TaxID=358 RepID=UPI000DD02B59|nr:transposase [Agrobacterium tumefaciens]MDP9789307.1 transposase [Agrobacterium tumefaciens]
MGRMEILTGVERRRDWSDDEKLSILQETAEPDAKIADVARRHDIRPQQIYTWRRKFAAAQSEPVVSFLPVALIATEPSDEAERPAPTDKPAAKRSTRPVRIEIGCKGGRVLKVEATIAPEVLKALIRSVEEA